MLFEAGFSSFSSKWGGYSPAGSLTGLVAVTEQSTAAGVPFANPNFTYRGWASAPSNNQQHNIWRASMTSLTGAHNFKVGLQSAFEVYRGFQNVDNQLSYTFNNGEGCRDRGDDWIALGSTTTSPESGNMWP